MEEEKSSLTEDDRKFLLDNGKYSETEEVRTEALRELQEWLKENPHIGADASPRNLLRFLRHSKYRLEVCKQRISNFYLVRSTVPEWFQNKDLRQPALRDLLELGTYLPLLKKDSSKRTTIIVRGCIHDPARFSHNDLMKQYHMVFDLVARRDETLSIYGANVILDLSNMSMGHIISPNKIQKVLHCMQDCYPVSPKRVDFIFAPKLLDLVMDIVLRFMTAKMRTRVHVHGKDLDSLHASVPPEILPREYGGTEGTVQELTDYWKKEALNAQNWFLEDQKYCSVLVDKKHSEGKKKSKVIEFD